MSDDERLTVTIQPGGEDAQEILCFAHYLCNEDGPHTMAELVNAVTLAAVQLGQTNADILELIEQLRPGAERAAAAIRDEGRRTFDA